MSRAAAWAIGLSLGAVAGSFNAGLVSYALPRTQKLVQEQLDAHPQVQELEQNELWTERHMPWIRDHSDMPAQVLDVAGGVASPVVFINREDSRKTVLFTHCGGQTCGFPFVVHGGVLGTILAEAFAIAGQESHGMPSLPLQSLQLRYKRPTMTGQILRVDTWPGNDGLEAKISDPRGRTLVEAHAKLRS